MLNKKESNKICELNQSVSKEKNLRKYFKLSELTDLKIQNYEIKNKQCWSTFLPDQFNEAKFFLALVRLCNKYEKFCRKFIKSDFLNSFFLACLSQTLFDI